MLASRAPPVLGVLDGPVRLRLCLLVMRCTLRQELVELRVTREVDRTVVANHGVEGPVGKAEHLAPGPEIEAGGGLRAEVGVVDDVADDRRRARDPASRRVAPAD